MEPGKISDGNDVQDATDGGTNEYTENILTAAQEFIADADALEEVLELSK
jgi:hypothetical protein